jgi:quercetin dioxygenase-like cupin family protein
MIPENGTLSRVIYVDDNIRVVLFAFDAGQELTEHTASMPAIIQVIRGEARLMLGEETVTALPGTWMHMPARLPHAVYALTPLVMLLTMLRGGKAA